MIFLINRLIIVLFYLNNIIYYIIYTIIRTAYLSVSLAVFNIMPIPPLDGSKVVFSLISDQAYYKLMRYERYGMVILLALVLTGVMSRPLNSAVANVFDKLMFAARMGISISGLF